MEPSQIPDFLGGPNTTPLIDDHGPWNDFEVVDGCRHGDIVGVRRKADGHLFTLADFEALPNNLLKDPKNSVIHF